MSPRLIQNTKWFSCILVLSGLQSWQPVSSIAVKATAKGPGTVEAQAKFFQDFFSVQLSPYKMEFGHVCEDPNTWEQRYEKKDFKNHRDMGKVRWGDKQGGYGEHYWDLNHAGHAGDHGDDNDDGSYNEHEHNDPYEEPSQKLTSTYDDPSPFSDDYDAEKAAQSPFDENNRAKRAQPRLRNDKEAEIVYGKRKTKDLYIKNRNEPRKKKRAEEEEEESTSDESKSDETEEVEDYKPVEEIQPPKQRKNKPAKVTHFKAKEVNYDDDSQNPNTPVESGVPEQPNYDIPYTEQKNEPLQRNTNQDINQNKPVLNFAQQRHPPRNQYVTNPVNPQENYEEDAPALTRNTAGVAPYVPYEAGAGVRQHYQPQFAATAARLFLDPATGNVVDRATGQAYVLQPIGLSLAAPY